MAEIVDPVFAVGGVAAKVAPFISKLGTVEEELVVFEDILKQDRGMHERVLTEFSHRKHLLDSCSRDKIDSTLYNCERAIDQINGLISKPLARIKEKDRVNFRQRVEWVFSDVKAWKELWERTQASLSNVLNQLLQYPLPPSPNSKNVSDMQFNKHDPDLVHCASKPPCPTIWAKTSPLQMGEISDEETLSRRRTPSEEYGSAGLGYGVVDRPKSAGPPTTISNKLEDHISDDEDDIGSFPGRREIALSRREEYESASLGHGVVDRPKSAGPPTTLSNKLEDHIWGNKTHF